MYGRGATDMKSGVAAFVAAAVDFVTLTPPDGAVVLAITGDEEGDATDGTVALLDWMAAQGERMTHCLVGEPTCPETLGDMMKIGRRGSMTVWFTVTGVQGHSRLSAPGEEPAACAGHAAGAADGRAVGRGDRPFRRLDPADHHHRLRQSGDQRDPGRGAGDGEHPLQRPAFRRQPDGTAAGRGGSGGDGDGGEDRAWRCRSRARAS